MKILISGVHSIAGTFLVEKLSPVHTVYGLDATVDAMTGVKEIFRCSEFERLPQVDAVIHLAGKDEDTIDWSRSLEYMENNLGLTKCIFEWFKRSNAKQFYYLSSIKVLGNRTDGLMLTEDMEPKPFGPLGESKYLVEQYLLNTWLLDKKVYVLRTSYLHGRGLFLNDNAKRIFNWITIGFPYFFGSFDCRRSFTSLDNLNFAIDGMLVKDVTAGVYHVSDDGSLAAREFFWLMGRALGKKVRVWRLGKGFIKSISKISDFFGCYFDSFEYKKLTLDLVVGNEKLKNALGVESMPFPLEAGLMKSVDEYVKYTKR